VTTIDFSWSTTHAKCNNCIYLSIYLCPGYEVNYEVDNSDMLTADITIIIVYPMH